MAFMEDNLGKSVPDHGHPDIMLLVSPRWKPAEQKHVGNLGSEQCQALLIMVGFWPGHVSGFVVCLTRYHLYAWCCAYHNPPSLSWLSI